MSHRFAYLNSTSPAASRRARNGALSEIFSGGFPFSRKLSAHKSCVNALAFSSGDARFMASAGDDYRIHIWDFHQEDLNSPICSFTGPKGNVFTLAFSAANRHLYSGGVDGIILEYDVSRMSPQLVSKPDSYCDAFGQHEDSVHAISCHPFQDEVLLSASEDGRVILHDRRANNGITSAQATLQSDTEFTGVQCHPTLEHAFVTSDNRGRVRLHDARMTFGPLSRRTGEGVVQSYNTIISKKSASSFSNPESSSVVFDREGTKMAVTMLHYLPTIYSLSDPNPLAVCSGRNHPDGTPVSPSERTYSNSCTTKHGSFGGSGLDTDEYYSAGSDDFRGYVWKIPSLQELTERRRIISSEEWVAQEHPHVFAFAQDIYQPRHVPVELSTPSFRLNGHKSIVNTTLIHPHFPHIMTSGIERHVLLHSPKSFSPSCQGLIPTSTDVRSLPQRNSEDRRRFIRALARTLAEGPEQSESEDELQTIALFDQILRQEGGADPFSVRQFAPDSDEEETREIDFQPGEHEP